MCEPIESRFLHTAHRTWHVFPLPQVIGLEEALSLECSPILLYAFDVELVLPIASHLTGLSVLFVRARWIANGTRDGWVWMLYVYYSKTHGRGQ
jgi:hypothetical protein